MTIARRMYWSEHDLRHYQVQILNTWKCSERTGSSDRIITEGRQKRSKEWVNRLDEIHNNRRVKEVKPLRLRGQRDQRIKVYKIRLIQDIQWRPSMDSTLQISTECIVTRPTPISTSRIACFGLTPITYRDISGLSTVLNPCMDYNTRKKNC